LLVRVTCKSKIVIKIRCVVFVVKKKMKSEQRAIADFSFHSFFRIGI